MKKRIKDESFKKKEDGGFQVLFDQKESPLEPVTVDEIVSFNSGHPIREVLVAIEVITKGSELESIKTDSNVDSAETLVALVRGLVGMVRTTASIYKLNVKDLLDKIQKTIEIEFNNQMKKNE